MLNALRRIASTWLGKILGGFLIVGLAGFGISNVLLDLGGTTIGKVGSEDITARAFQRGYNRQLNAFAQQYGQMPTGQQATALGIPGTVLSQLVADAAVDQTARDMGLGVSEARLAKSLRQDPAFADILGAFDRAAFTQRLRENGYTEAEYFDEQTKGAERTQLTLGLFAGTPVPLAAQELINRYQADRRTLEYVTLTPDNIDAVAAPTDDDLKTYLAAHQADFRTKETRTASLMVLSPELLAANMSFADDEIAAEYDRTKASRVTPEKRTVAQVVLPDAAAITAFETAKAAGTGFADTAAAAGLTPTDLGTLTKAQINDPTLADAAFGLKEGEFTIVAGAVGKRAVSVSRIEPGGQVSLSDARADIIKSLGLAAAKAQMVDQLDQIEELRAAFKPLDDIATRFKLPLTKVTLTADGAALSSVAAIPEADRAKVAGAIFSSERDKLAPTVSLNANNNVWFDLAVIEPARDQTLDEVRDAVTAAWTKEKTDAAMKAEAAKSVASLDAGQSLTDLATARGLIPTLSLQITRRGDDTINQALAAAAFSGGPDSHGSAVDADGNYVVFHVTGVEPAPPDALKTIKPALEQQTRDSYYSAFVDGLGKAIGYRINQQALDKILPADGNGQ